MSEELLQTIPQQIGKFTYYKLGNTTIKQLVEAGLLPKKRYNKLETKQPDGIMMFQKQVIAYIEFKQPSELRTDKQIKKAILQQFDIAKLICKLLIVTDGTNTYWINTQNGEKIIDNFGNDIKTTFNNTHLGNIDALEFLIEQIIHSISKTNSQIKQPKFINPAALAKKLWQTIWAATGKSPIKCLYNVVELFIFRFLSDLRVLDNDYGFEKVYKKSLVDAKEALEYYAKNSRDKIHQLFPQGKDGTTIINGTIFVDEKGTPNLSQAFLFARSLKYLNDFKDEFGSLTNIDKQFKTKLYENFLKQEVEALGQYFTPRKLVQSIIRMAKLNDTSFQYQDKRICDPFCGVGGFLLEVLNLNDSMRKEFIPNSQGNIHPSFILNGFDKGFEKDDERTIILAKANMLIYLAEILFKYPNLTNSFADSFNSTFKLFKDNLGTFGYIIEKENQKFDYILTNPPYVTSGSSIIKEELRKTPYTKDEYPINATGLEGLSIEWIIKALKKGGRAFIIIPDGILSRKNDKKLRDYILSHCTLDAIISLPIKTFYANDKKTYIIVLTKKFNHEDHQIHPVFTYLVSEIGEKLTSVRREDIPVSHLPEMEMLFNYFSASKENFANQYPLSYPRCKIQPITHFINSSDWIIDYLWSKEEIESLGIVDQTRSLTTTEFDNEIENLQSQFENYLTIIAKLKSPLPPNLQFHEYINKKVSDICDLSITTNKSFLTRNYVLAHPGSIPVYGASKFIDEVGYGYIQDNLSNMKYFEDCLTWNIDGSIGLFFRKGRFSLSEKVIPLIVKDEMLSQISIDYLKHTILSEVSKNPFTYTNKGGKSKLGEIIIKIPTSDGLPDLNKQTDIANYYEEINNATKHANNLTKNIFSTMNTLMSLLQNPPKK